MSPESNAPPRRPVGRLLQIVGLCALLAWTGAGLFFWLSVKEKVVLEVREEGSQEDLRQSLLEDDVKTLRADVRELTAALRTSLGRLADDLDSRGQARQRELLQRLAALEDRAARAGMPAGDKEMAAPPPATQIEHPIKEAAKEPAEEPEHQTAAAGEKEEPAPPRGPEAAAKPARHFLSFSLPGEGFRFDARQRFEIIPDLSRVGFDGTSTLHDFTGLTSDVAGHFVLRPSAPGEGCDGTLSVKTASLKTGIDDRDKGMRERLETREHPKITFTLTGIAPRTVDAEGMKVQGEARGTLEIRGRGRPFAMPITIEVDEARRLVVKGEAKLALSSYGIEAPSQLGLIKMDDEVRVWVALRTRAMGVVR